jgi:hypothetical protein
VPVATLVASTLAGLLAVGVAQGALAAGLARGSASFEDLCAGLLGFTALLPATGVAGGYVWLARTRGCRARWALLACSLAGLWAGTLALGYRAPAGAAGEVWVGIRWPLDLLAAALPLSLVPWALRRPQAPAPSS